MEPIPHADAVEEGHRYQIGHPGHERLERRVEAAPIDAVDRPFGPRRKGRHGREQHEKRVGGLAGAWHEVNAGADAPGPYWRAIETSFDGALVPQALRA